MKIELDFEDCWKGVIEHLTSRIYSEASRKAQLVEIKECAEQVLNCLSSYGDMAEAVKEILDRNDTVKELFLDLTDEDQSYHKEATNERAEVGSDPILRRSAEQGHHD